MLLISFNKYFFPKYTSIYPIRILVNLLSSRCQSEKNILQGWLYLSDGDQLPSSRGNGILQYLFSRPWHGDRAEVISRQPYALNSRMFFKSFQHLQQRFRHDIPDRPLQETAFESCGGIHSEQLPFPA